MKTFLTACRLELLKMTRAKIFLFSIIFFAFIGLMMGFMMFLANHPELAMRSAAMAAKTSALGKGDWPNLLDLLVQIGLVLSMLGSGFTTAWLFGREYLDRTLKDLLALPVTRTRIVLAKYTTALLWNILLAGVCWLCGLAAGAICGLPGFTSALVFQKLQVYLVSVTLTLVLMPLAGFLATVTRGYLLPVAYLILALIVTQFMAIGMPALAPYFPWAIPAVFSGIGGESLPGGSLASLLILISSGAVGLAGTILWLKYADQN